MSGYDVLWVPGTDHAGIATQMMVERDLLKERNKQTRFRKRKNLLRESGNGKKNPVDRLYISSKNSGHYRTGAVKDLQWMKAFQKQ